MIDDDYAYEDWDGEPEDPRSTEDLAAVNAAISSLEGWKRRHEWRSAEVDHFRRQIRRYVKELAEKAPLGEAERRELNVLRGKVVTMQVEIDTLKKVITDA